MYNVLKYVIKSFVIILLLISFISCKKLFGYCDSPPKPYRPLSSNIKLWLPYSKDTNLVFENNILENDTILLRDFYFGDADIYGGDECPPDRGQFLNCNFIDLKSNDTIKAQSSCFDIFYSYRKNTKVFFMENLNNVQDSTSFRKFESVITLNQKVFKDCIWVECTSSDNCDQNGITKYFFARKKGLVAYVRKSTLWVLKS